VTTHVYKVAEPDKEEQLLLFNTVPDKEIPNKHSFRSHLGLVIEKVVCSSIGAKDIKINGGCDVCFDLKKGDSFIEVKGLSGGGVFIYKFRLEKEVKADVKAYYLFAEHSCSFKPNLSEVYSCVCSTLCDVYLIPLSDVATMCYGKILQGVVLGSQDFGYSRKGYADGYFRLSKKEIQSKASSHSVIIRSDYIGIPLEYKLHTDIGSEVLGETSQLFSGPLTCPYTP